MTQSQFKYISELSWEWYRENMKSWAIEMLRNLQNAPQWVKDCLASDCVVCPSMDEKVFELAHNEDIEKILRISQKRNFEVNFSEEQREFYKAIRDNDEYKMIDALCDMCVVSMNAGIDYREGVIDKLSIIGVINLHRIIPSNVLSDRNIGYIVAMLQLKGYDPYLCLLETIKELRTRTGKWCEKEGKWIKDVGAYTFEEADKIASNYDTENERELYEDNTEFWRWQLHIKGEYCSFKIKKWYKANYDECKKGGENA